MIKFGIYKPGDEIEESPDTLEARTFSSAEGYPFDPSEYTIEGRLLSDEEKIKEMEELDKELEGVEEPDGPEWTEEEFLKILNDDFETNLIEDKLKCVSLRKELKAKPFLKKNLKVHK